MSEALANVARANRFLLAAWKTGLLSKPRIDADALEAVALRGLDRTAFGAEDHWREPFERLVTSLREEADLNPLGRTMAHSQIVHLLRARIRAVDLWRRLGTGDQSQGPPPIIVLGQMRSGSTRIQRLLACDDRLQHTQAWQSLSPVPAVGRKLRASAILTALKLLNSEVARIHPATATDAEEEFGWLAFGFGAAQFEAQWRIPSFSRWWENADVRPLYCEFRALLHLNRLARRDSLGKPYLLKTPHHLQNLAGVLDAFPGARLIVLKRNLDEVVASSASLVWNQMRIQSNSADKAWIGREWMRKTALRQRRMAAVLAGRPDTPVIDVDYDRVSDDWLGEIRRVYDFLDMTLTPDLIQRMERLLDGAKSHLGHRYSLEDFGLQSGAFNTADMAYAR